MKTAQFYKDKAVAQIESGFKTKAAQKEALEFLSRSYEKLRDESRIAVMDAGIEHAGGRPDFDQDAYCDFIYSRELPLSLHQYRPAKHDDIAEFAQGNAELIGELVELRELAKATPVVRPEKSEEQKLKYLSDVIQGEMTTYLQRVKAHCVRGLKLNELFGGLNIHASMRYCVNQFGTHYTQVFWYMDGKIAPFSVVCALSGALEDDKLMRELKEFLNRQ